MEGQKRDDLALHRDDGFIYLVAKKIIVDNAAEGRGKRQAEAVGTYGMLDSPGIHRVNLTHPVPLMRIINRLSTVLTVLTWILGWAAYPSAGTLGEYRSDGTTGKETGSVVGTVWLVGAYERPARLKVFKNRDFCGPSGRQ